MPALKHIMTPHKPSLMLRVLHYPHLALVVSILVILKLLSPLAIQLVNDIDNDISVKSTILYKSTNQLGRAQLSDGGEYLIFSEKYKSSNRYQPSIINTLAININDKPKNNSKIETKLLLPDNGFNYHLISWSPDKNRIAYIRENDNLCNIFSARVTEHDPEHHFIKNELKLLDCSEIEMHDLAWAHNDNLLYFTAKKPINSDALLPDTTSGFSLYQLNLKTKNVIRLSDITKLTENDSKLSASPDGKWLSYIRNNDQLKWQIHLYNIATEEHHLILETGLQIHAINWHPNSDKLILATNAGPKTLLFDGDLSNISPHYQNKYTLDASYTQQKDKLLITTINSEANLWQHNNPIQLPDLVENKKAISLTINPDNNYDKTINNIFPAYANNSKRLAFVSNRDHNSEIMLLDEQGKEHQLTHKTHYNFMSTQLHWSKDDTQIMFSANNGLYVLTLNSGIITRVTDKSYNVTKPSWSVDGQHIYFSSDMSGRWQIWRMTRKGQDLQQITKDSGANARESHDGKTLYFAKHNLDGLWQKTLDASPAITLANTESLLIPDYSQFAHVSWKVFKNGIYYHSFANNDSSIRYWDFINAKSQLVLAKNGSEINCSQFSISHDQQDIALLHNLFQTEISLVDIQPDML